MKKDFENMISSYLDEDLSDRDKALFEKHIKENPIFLEKINNIKKIIQSLNKTQDLSPSPDFLVNLEKSIENQEKKQNWLFNSTHSIKYWLGSDIKATLGFSFILLAMTFFIFNGSNNLQTNISSEKDSPNSSVDEIKPSEDNSGFVNTQTSLENDSLGVDINIEQASGKKIKKK